MGGEIGERILEKLDRLDEKIDRTAEIVSTLGVEVALFKERLANYLTEAQVMKMFIDHQMTCPGAKKTSSSVPRPVSGNGVDWVTVLKYVSIIASAIGAGIATGKFAM